MLRAVVIIQVILVSEGKSLKTTDPLTTLLESIWKLTNPFVLLAGEGIISSAGPIDNSNQDYY
jgi:hypothetical protein